MPPLAHIYGLLRRLVSPIACATILLILPTSLAHAQAYFAGTTIGPLGNGYSRPLSVAADKSGNLYVIDESGSLKEIVAGTGGAAPGTVNANSTTIALGSSLISPKNVAVDASGNVFVTDKASSTSFTGVVREVVAGTGGAAAGQVNGSSTVVTFSNFNQAYGLAVDGSGDVFVTDVNASILVVKEIVAASGTVNTNSPVNLVGSGFNGASALAVDGSGDVFVLEYSPSGSTGVVQEIVAGSGGAPAGTVTTSSTVNTVATGFVDGDAIAVDRGGNLFVGEQFGTAVKEVVAGTGGAPAGKVNTNSTVLQFNDGFSGIDALAVDGAGNVFVADSQNNAVKEIELNSVNFGSVAIATATPPTHTLQFNFTAATTIGAPAILTQGAPNKDFVDTGSGTCKSGASFAAGSSCTVIVSFSPQYPGPRLGAVELLSNSTPAAIIATANVKGIGTGPQVAFPSNPNTNTVATGFSLPAGIALDGSGNVYVADYGSHSVKEIVAGTGGAPAGTVNASSTVSVFSNGFTFPYGVAVDGAGDVIVADTYTNGAVKVIVAGTGGAPAGTVTPNSTVNTIGNGFTSPVGVAVDGAGNVFVTDTNAVKEIVAGTGGAPAGTVNANATVQILGGGFNVLAGVAVDGAGNVFVADHDPTTQIATVKEIVAGTGGAPAGTVNANSTVNTVGIGFAKPFGVAVDGSGNVFVGDLNNIAVKEIISGTGGAPAGTVNVNSTVTIVGSGFVAPFGVALDASGNVFVTDTTKNALEEITLATPPSLTFSTQADGTTGTAQSVTVQNVGTAPLNAVSPGLTVASNFTQVGGGTSVTDCNSSFSLASGAICNLSLEFAPEEPTTGTVNGSVVLTDNNLNASPSATQTIPLSGSATAPTIVVAPTTLAAATVGASYNQSLSASGGVSPYTYSVTAGALPAGITLSSTGVLSGTPTAVGSFSFSVTAKDNGGFTGTQAYSLTVQPGTPVLTFATIAAETYGNPPFTVIATSNSPGAITYSLVSGPATVTSAGLVTLTGAGVVTIQASQAATTNYLAATKQVSFTVQGAVPALNFAIASSSSASGGHTYGDAPFTVMATSNSPGAITYSLVSGPATVTSAGLVTLTGAGVVTIKASQAASGGYLADSQTATFTVNKESPKLNEGTVQATFGQTAGVSVSEVTAGTSVAPTGVLYYAFDAPATSGSASVQIASTVTVPVPATLNAGTHTLNLLYSGDTNYASVTAQSSFTVAQAVPTLTWATPAPITYGTALSGAQLNATASVPGTIIYTPAAGTILGGGTQTLSASFTPTDTTNYATPPAKTVSLVVNAAATATALTSSATSVAVGASVTFTATVSSMVGTPAGSVIFYDGGTSLGSVNLTNGVATYTTTSLTSASHTITAVYQANPDFMASTSNPVTEMVGPFIPFTFAAGSGSSANVTVKQGATGTTTLTITPNPTFAGTVSLSCTGLQGIAACTISPQSVTFVAGGAPQTVTVTINTAQMAALNPAPLDRPGSPLSSLATMLWLPGLLAAGFGAKRGQTPLQRRLLLLALVCLSLGGVAALSGCGSSSSSMTASTQPGTYHYSVVGTSGSSTESIAGVLTVQ